MNIEEDLTSLKEIVAIRKERCHGFIESDSCLISTKRLETLLTAYEKEKEKNKELEKENKKLNLIRLQFLVSSFPDTTETYKKYRKELDELLKEE